MEQNSGSIATLDSKFTGLFEIVNTLPNINDAQLGKIYCVKDTSSTDTENKYIEWVKLKNIDDTYKFEKVGEFNAAPDLSGYAKLSGCKFTGDVCFGNLDATRGRCLISGIRTLTAEKIESDHHVFAVNNTHLDVGTQESFVFTLEDGSTVTKSIRVISTTSQAGA